MKLILLLLVALLATSRAGAEEIDRGLPGNSVLTASASGSSRYHSGSSLEGHQVAVAASAIEERALGRALELQPSDLFAHDDLSNDTGEFELKLPEETLPESDIPLTVNDKVEYFVNFFQTSGRKSFGRWLSRSERYIPMMKEILREKGLPEDLVYLAMIESGFSPHAYSVASAVGPWQFISGTGKRYSLRIDPWIDERRDPIKSTMAAAMYLKDLYLLFNRDWYLAAAGYNAGENKILRAIDMYDSTDFWQLAEGSYLKRETKDYVPKLLAAAIVAKDPARYGFADVAYLPPVEFDTVVIPSRTDLEVVAKASGVSLENIRELNPELRKGCTPPDYPNYELKLPVGRKEVFEREFCKIPEEERYKEKVTYTRYRAGKKDTLASLARRFGVGADEIAALNKIGKSTRLRGKVLIVPVKADVADASPGPARSKARKSSKEFIKYYTVKSGDTLYALAKKFKVPEKTIASWNNLKGKKSLKTGKRIIVAKYLEKDGSLVRQGVDNG